MGNRIVVTKYNNKNLVLFIKDEQLVKVRVLRDINEHINTVYLGRVQTVKENINSCFVKYEDNIGYLDKKNIKAETVLPVTLKKETSANKENEVTDKICISGIYAVVSDSINKMTFSSRIKALDKQRFNDLDASHSIIRSNALNAELSDIKNEIAYLTEILNHINSIKDKRVDNSILYKGIPELIDIIFSEDISLYEEILTDIDEAFDIINAFFELYRARGILISIPLNRYSDDSVSLPLLLSVSSKMDRATNRIVHLKSDAYITIDYTEAMTVIDVNSGTTRFKGDKALVIHSINMEACEEVAKQLKLRNLSGIIIVDFINEYTEENKRELSDTLKELLKEDDMHAKFYGLTRLGLAEITRKRTYKTLREQLR